MVNFNAGDPNDSEDDVQSQDGDTGIPFHHASTAASVQGPEPGDNAYEAMEGPHFDDHAADSDSDDDTPDHEESGSDDEEDDDDDGLASGRTPGPCCVAVRNNLRQEHNTAIQVLRTSHQQRETVLNDHLAERNRRIAELETRIGELNTEVAELNAQVLARKRGGHSHTTRVRKPGRTSLRQITDFVFRNGPSCSTTSSTWSLEPSHTAKYMPYPAWRET